MGHTERSFLHNGVRPLALPFQPVLASFREIYYCRTFGGDNVVIVQYQYISSNIMGDYDLGLLDDDAYKVEVLRTKLLGIAECFMYRLPNGSKSPYR